MTGLEFPSNPLTWKQIFNSVRNLIIHSIILKGKDNSVTFHDMLILHTFT